MDRRRVYDLLEEAGIDVPRHVFVSRDGYVSTGEHSNYYFIYIIIAFSYTPTREIM